MPVSTHQYRPDIDGLRAVSILSVLAYHAFPSLLPGGFVGVDIFFVISGYLINGIIIADLQNGGFSYVRFYSRRIKRIFPALSLVLIACLICGWLFLFPGEWRQLGKHAFGGATFVSNLVLMKEGGYFDPESASKPLLHLWSLGIEEQFYITWPLLLALIWKWKSPKLITPFIVASICISFLANILFLGRSRNAVFYFPLTRYWEILLGAFLAAQTGLRRDILSRHRVSDFFGRTISNRTLSLLGVALLVGALALAREDGWFPGYVALLPTCAAMCLVAAGPDCWFNKVVLSRRFMVFIGLISYPLYLWHWPVLVLSRLMFGNQDGWQSHAIALMISVVLAYWTYKYWELNIRNSRHVAYVVTFLTLLVGFAGTVGLLAKGRVLPARLSNLSDQRILAATDDWSYPFGGNFKKRKGYQVGMITGSGRGQIVFIGDSHLEQYYPRIKRLTDEGSEQFPSSVFITAGGCPPLPEVNMLSSGYACDSFLEFAMQYAKRPDVRTVVFGAHWEAYLGHPSGAKRQDATPGLIYKTDDPKRTPLSVGMPFTDRVFQNFETSIHLLVGKGKSVFVVLSNPSDISYDPRRMISRVTNTVRARNVNRGEFVEAVRPVVDRVREAAERGGATVIDPVPFMCVDTACQTISSDGQPYYKDGSHLRASYAAEAAVFVDQVFRASNR